MTPLSVPATTETLEQKFERLLARWRAEVAHISSSTQIAAHPAYQEIIAMGQDALPFLLRELERSKDGHLSKALRAITGANPITPEMRGKIALIAEAWLRWAKENGYQW